MPEQNPPSSEPHGTSENPDEPTVNLEKSTGDAPTEPTPESDVERTSVIEGEHASVHAEGEHHVHGAEGAERAEGEDTTPPPAAPEKKSRKGLLAVIAVVVVLLLIGGGVGAYFLLAKHDHKISTPATAGGMKRDTAKEKSFGKPLDDAEAQFKNQVGDAVYVKRAIYNQDGAKRGPKGALVFFGAKLTDKHAKDESPSKWIADKFTKGAKANGLTVAKVSAGGDDGQAACASIKQPAPIAICVWRTEDSVGEVVPTVPGYDAKSMAKLMVALRGDVETK